PVSIRGVHNSNVFNKYGELIYKLNTAKMYKSLLIWSYEEREEQEVMAYFWKKTFDNYHYLKGELAKEPFFYRLMIWLKFGYKYPRLLQVKYFNYSNPLYQRLRLRNVYHE